MALREIVRFVGWTLMFVLPLGSLLSSRPAKAQENLLGWSDKALSTGGSLLICGGGNISAEIYEEFLRLAGGSQAKLVIVPTAFRFETRSQAENTYRGWHHVGARSVHFLDTDSRDEADQDDFVAELRAATGVWICGGDQGRLADMYVGTKVEYAIQDVLNRGGVVGGTSAGAAIMSRTMIRSGTRYNAVTDRGMSLLRRAIIDQHFLVRGRQPRLLNALTDRPGVIGLGVDEGTALVVRGNRLRVVGSSDVVVCLGETEDREPWIRTLRPGMECDLEARRDSDEQPIRELALRLPSDVAAAE